MLKVKCTTDTHQEIGVGLEVGIEDAHIVVLC